MNKTSLCYAIVLCGGMVFSSQKQVLTMFRCGGYEYVRNHVSEAESTFLFETIPEPRLWRPDYSVEERYLFVTERIKYWTRKGLLDMASLERAYFSNSPTEVVKVLADVRASIRTLDNEVGRDVYFQAYVSEVIYSLLRIIDDRSDSRPVFSDRLVTETFLWRGNPLEDNSAERTDNCMNQRLLTALNMLVTANRLVLFRIRTGRFPETLDSISTNDGATLDAWGRELRYVVENDKWLLKARDPNGYDDGSTFDDHLPWIHSVRNLVLCSETCRARLKLFEKGEGDFRGKIRLDVKTGKASLR